MHANLHALNAVLAALEKEGIEEIWCLGDVVGYGGDPEACVAIVRERCAGTVRGNHDAAAVEAALRASFNPHARAAIERQADLLTRDALEWLGGLPAVIELDDVVLLHAGYRDPERFPYVLESRDAARELAALKAGGGSTATPTCRRIWWMDANGRVEDSRGWRRARLRSIARAATWSILARWDSRATADPRAACAIFDRGSESRALPARSLRHRSRAVVDPARGHAEDRGRSPGARAVSATAEAGRGR